MRSSSKLRFRLYSSCLIAALVTVSCTISEMHPTAMSGAGGQRAGFDVVIGQHARTMLDEGRQTFRFDTFGSEAFWGGALQLHRAIAGAKLGGVGPGVSPKTALAVGLKVDAAALPAALVEQMKQGVDTPKGRFYHDGRFATLRDVVNHYDGFLRLALTEQEKSDLIQHLLGL